MQAEDVRRRRPNCRPARCRRTSAPACPPRTSRRSPARRWSTSSGSRARSSPNASTSSPRALSVPVHTTADVDPLGEGDDVRRRHPRPARVARRRRRALGELEGQRGRLDRQARVHGRQIDHDARWGYDARKHALAPLNSEATTLSQAGRAEGRADPPPARRACRTRREPDDSRFDSGAFTFHETAERPPRTRRGTLPRAGRRTAARSRRRTTRSPSRPSSAPTTSQPQRPAPDRRPARGAPPPPRRAGGRQLTRRRPSAAAGAADAARRAPAPRSLDAVRVIDRADDLVDGLAAPAAPAPQSRRPRQPGTPTAATHGSRVALGTEGPRLDAELGRDRLRRAHGRRPGLTPAAPDGADGQAIAPNRSRGTRVSSAVSEPCWPIMLRPGPQRVAGVVVGDPLAGGDEHVPDARQRPSGCDRAPNHPASIASSRVATQERSPSTSRQRSASRSAARLARPLEVAGAGSAARPPTLATPVDQLGSRVEEHVAALRARRSRRGRR